MGKNTTTEQKRPLKQDRRPLTMEQAKQMVEESRKALAILAKDDGRMHPTPEKRPS
jgi:hypothetical protein